MRTFEAHRIEIHTTLRARVIRLNQMDREIVIVNQTTKKLNVRNLRIADSVSQRYECNMKNMDRYIKHLYIPICDTKENII